MLTTLNGTSENELIKRISAARGNSEPQVEPTDEPTPEESVDKEINGEPSNDSEDVRNNVQDESELEELDETEEVNAQSDDAEGDLFVEIDGEEIALSDIKAWREGNLRQSDYTKKTQEVAEQRKTLEAEKSKLAQLQSELANKSQQLEAIIAESTLSQEQLAELKEDDPEAYIKYQERMQQRQQLLNQTRQNVDIGERDKKLVEANPNWLENGKPTEQFTKDMNLVRNYTKELGYTAQELAGIERSGDAHHWLTLLDAARGREAMKELAKIKQSAETKKSKKVATVTKPRGKGPSNLDRQIEQARAKFKATGHERDAFELRKLQKLKQRGQ